MRRPTRHTPFLVTAIRQLDSGVNAHSRWLGQLHQALICGVEAPPSTTAQNSHTLCAFGRWYYGDRPADWQQWQAELDVIEELHTRMHGLARDFFSRRDSASAIPVEEYAAFVEASIRFKNAVRELEFKMIQEVCLVDHLTGVWNRASMFQRLTEEHGRTLRGGHPACLCMMDLDHFKAINDCHGHIAGDEVLQAVIDIANASLRTYDSIFRYGGEEFLFCLPNATVATAAAVMERVRTDIEAASIQLRNGVVVHLTASFGIAPLLSASPVEESIELADRGLFCAKANGRNQVCCWDPDSPTT